MTSTNIPSREFIKRNLINYLTTWHQRLGQLNFPALKKHLIRHDIKFIDDTRVCERSKANKQYNRTPQQRAERPYQYIHTDLVGPIISIGFGGKRYFFTFTDDHTRITETYTAKKKSEWFCCLKAFYNLARTRTKLDRPTERLQSDYGSEFQSRKVDKWLTNQGIVFEQSAPVEEGRKKRVRITQKLTRLPYLLSLDISLENRLTVSTNPFLF